MGSVGLRDLLTVSVRGPWRTRGELAAAFATQRGDFLLAGEELYNRRSRYRLSVMANVDAGQTRITCCCFEQSLRGAREVQRAGSALLRAGGTSIMADQSGLTHSPQDWVQLEQSGRVLDTYAAYVRFVATRSYFGSCGMQNFGLPDVRVSSQVGLVEASRTISAFNLYLLLEEPTLATGHTFTATEGAPRFRLKRTADGAEDLPTAYRNPKGTWQLAPA